jgi:hypothetical protein
MRKFVLIIALVAMLVALDAVANDLRFTTGLVLEFREFVRLVNRFIGTALG